MRSAACVRTYSPSLAAVYRPDDGGPERVTFLSHAGRALWLTGSAWSPDADPDPDRPFVTAWDSGPSRADVAVRASGRHAALIAAGNEVNVATCRLTGDFFRAWGMPGARYEQRQAVPGRIVSE